MQRRHTQRKSGLGARTGRCVLLALISVLILAACTPTSSDPTAEPDAAEPSAVSLPQRCLGDGAVQTWLLLPLDPPESELLAAYHERQVIEFQAQVVGRDDSPALQPHRRFILQEAAEGITLALDYQGDAPLLIQGQSYRFVAWADFAPPASEPITATEQAVAGLPLPASRGYELQIYDDDGLLFVGLTDVAAPDGPLGVRMEDAPGACAPAPAPNNPCVASRQVMPLRVQWGQEELILHPGEDGQLQAQGATFVLSLFRNRQVTYAEPACGGYSEHRRSLRIDRIDPPPIILAPVPITTTVPLTDTTPLPDETPTTPEP